MSSSSLAFQLEEKSCTNCYSNISSNQLPVHLIVAVTVLILSFIMGSPLSLIVTIPSLYYATKVSITVTTLAYMLFIHAKLLVHRRSSSFDNGKAKYYGVWSAPWNFLIIASRDIIHGHVLAYRVQVSILNSKKIAKIDQETCHKARSGFSKWDSDIFELMIVLCTITAQNIGLASAGPARLPAVTCSLRHHACD